MKRTHLFPIAVLANLSMFFLCAMSCFDTIPPIVFLPLLHVLLFWLNLKAGHHWWQVVLLGVEHIAVTISFIILDARLYQKYVYADDPAHFVLSFYSLWIGFAITVILLIASLITFAGRQRKLSQTT